MKGPVNAAQRSLPDAPEGWRRKFALGVLGVLALGILGRAFQLQVVSNDRYSARGDNQYVRMQQLRAHRGAVRDRNGEPLALSAPVVSITADPDKLLAAPQYHAALAALLQQTPRQLGRYLEARKRDYDLLKAGPRPPKGPQKVYLKRSMTPDEGQRIAELKAPGVETEPDYRRFYPAGEVAAHVVGFLDFEGNPASGVERTRDELLAGTPGKRRVIRDNKKRIVEDPTELTPAQPGADVQVTLDLRLQYLAYRELKAAVTENKAKGGLIVLADAHSGDILALASQPGFNPNRSDVRDPEALRNRAVALTFEPGSTVKPLMVAQALDTGVIGPDYRVDTGNGFLKISNVSVRDVHAAGEVDLATLLAKSSNVGAVYIGQKLGTEQLWNGYTRFGFGDRVAAGLPFEERTVLRDFHRWRPSDTVTASYGYSFTANALQLVRAYCAIANDGLMPAISILKRDHEEPPQRVVSARTAQLVRTMLEGVTVKGGTGTKAAVPGYRVAGKTGTVKKNGKGGYIKGAYQSAFIGMLPAQQPSLVALVMIDEPGNGDYYGGAVSAPVFGRVMAGAARLLQIKPDELSPPLEAPTPAPAPAVPTQQVDAGPALARAQP